MASPAKKRKLNSDGKKTVVPSRGLEYFFAKQRQASASSPGPASQNNNQSDEKSEGSLTDEELARKLQAEWDAEARSEQGQEREQQVAKPVVKDPPDAVNVTRASTPIPITKPSLPSLPNAQAGKASTTLSL